MKNALLVNAIFSGISGIALIGFRNHFANVFEVSSSTPFLIIGLALAFFAGTILYERRKLKKLRIAWIITQDMLWVLASIYVLAAKPFIVSETGNYIIGIIALLVFAMAINQWIALRRMGKAG